jgi:hypothetical protein
MIGDGKCCLLSNGFGAMERKSVCSDAEWFRRAGKGRSPVSCSEAALSLREERVTHPYMRMYDASS